MHASVGGTEQPVQANVWRAGGGHHVRDDSGAAPIIQPACGRSLDDNSEVSLRWLVRSG